jgi:hypothetical protein
MESNSPMDSAHIPIEERLDLPPCQYCGGRARWLNTRFLDLGRWRWHCAHCSPPPTGAVETGDLEDESVQ